MSTKRLSFRRLLSAAAVLTVSAAFAPIVAASETRGFVVKWLYYANVSRDSDCPHGLNPGSDVLFQKILKERNTPPAEIEKLMATFPYSMFEANIGNRGSINGKPANVYVNPTSVKDPMLYLGEGHTGLGFNLDGKEGPNNFTDPETGEKGVDNQFYRVVGCVKQLRSAAHELPTWPEVQWDMIRDHTPAWLIEISGIDDLKDDDDVVVKVALATSPIVRNANGLPQADVTFTAASNPRTAGNVAHAKIKNGLLTTTEKFNFFMPGEPFSQAEYAFREAKLRIKFNDDGTVVGILGGYQDWRIIYTSWAAGGVGYEINAGFDFPGLYYALRKSADAYPDPRTGQNAYISSAYKIEAVPAYIEHSSP